MTELGWNMKDLYSCSVVLLQKRSCYFFFKRQLCIPGGIWKHHRKRDVPIIISSLKQLKDAGGEELKETVNCSSARSSDFEMIAKLQPSAEQTRTFSGEIRAFIWSSLISTELPYVLQHKQCPIIISQGPIQTCNMAPFSPPPPPITCLFWNIRGPFSFF